MFFQVLVMNNYETCTDMYIIRTAKSMPCMYHVKTRIYNNECKYFIHTMFRPCIYTNILVFVCMFVCLACLDHVYTMYIHDMYNFTLPWTRNTKKKLQRAGYEPTIVCIKASCLNHYTTSMLASNRIVTGYVYYCFIWLGRLVTRRRTRHSPGPAPRAAMT